MIKSFKSKGLAAYWETDSAAKIGARLADRIVAKLDALDAASAVDDLRLPTFGLHAPHRFQPTRHAISVNGHRRITFEFDGDAYAVDLKQYR